MVQNRIDFYNREVGILTGVDCPLCKNKGDIAILENGHEFFRRCSCMVVRKNIKRLEKSGLSNLLDDYTFDKYKAVDGWQKKLLESAKRYIDDCEGKWFYIGGQVGCGKTHICTAIVGEFIKKGYGAKYMLWRDEIVKLKSIVMDNIAYSDAMETLKNIKVLYVDDFFKTGNGDNPTSADINIAFEILNYRYNNKNLITIISSERSVDDLLDIDSAIASRIYQRTKDYCVNINQDIEKNYRLR